MANRPGTEKKRGAELQHVEWRRIGRWMYALGLVGLLLGGSFWMLSLLQDPEVLPLKVVRIEGEFQHLKRTDLEQAVGREISGSFFTVDLDRIRAAALELPWVDQVTVRRVWPSTLRMAVVEQVPLARWGEHRLVNGRGKVFAPVGGEIPGGLPGLSGPEGNAQVVVERYREIVQKLAAIGLQVELVSQDERRAWSVGLAGGVELKLGSVDSRQRFDRFVRIYPELQRVQGKRPKRVDLRYTNGVAVLWEEQALPEQEKEQEEMKTSAAGVGTAFETGRGQV
jgi:cell division protein FtsQ